MFNYFIPILLLSSFFSFSQNLECSDFRTGEFRYTDSNLSGVIIIRTDKMQIERYEATGQELQLYIDWISDCEYILTYKKIVNPSSKIAKINMTGKEIHVKIIKIEGNRMTFLAKFEGEEFSSDLIKLLDN